jgi:sialate O-acetylesterase
MPIRGILWDQGESGSGIEWVDQYTMMGALIRGWRRELGQPDVPFLYVQKPNGGGCAWDPADPVTRYADQFAPLPKTVPENAIGPFGIDRGEYIRLRKHDRTFMVPSTDLGGTTHPGCKSGYGAVYGRKIAFSGPTYAGHAIEGDKVRVRFTHVGQGLAFRHAEKLQGFAVAGAEGKLHWADAAIDGDTVVVSSPAVASPVAVRYAWAAGIAWANLFNKDGLPAVSFRTDDPAAAPRSLNRDR